ncbi:hypothetical protein CKA32_002207 [Geitlerinema sp. FC II]|uniref:hypothetical protein n=1 Tax=Baaleninema simplex TaxID=2862350 RepID=UPI000346490C|nr:hypothetical protein [Baaleninema simplex]MDC0836040.1 hypothetical protein [Geitlerinema sp. CS-897]PPT07010.1 hypothetical protein CKA32_002207 [Geitlerinema sp. FC II]
MTVRATTHPLKTHAITLTSNISSTTVTGDRISRLETSPDPGESSVHLEFKVQPQSGTSDMACGAEELDFILEADDAVELGMSLLEMGLGHTDRSRLQEVFDRLSHLIAH